MRHKIIILTSLLLTTHLFSAQIAVIGTGYVGLVTGAGLAHFGNKVTCADIDTKKIRLLENGIIPIYEPGLEELVLVEKEQQRLFFSDNPAQAIRDAEAIFIAVGTPMNEDGSADLHAIRSVLTSILNNLNCKKLVVMKSTVPIGTGELICDEARKVLGTQIDNFEYVSNPEFLREGSAIHDFLYPDRLVFGINSERALDLLKQIYQPLFDAKTACAVCNVPTAETIKYASNAFLATKLSFINEIANLCDATGADAITVAYGMGLDKRISPLFLRPGPGFGGSCFPKDTQALLHTAQMHNVSINTVHGALITNQQQMQKPLEKARSLLGSSLENKTITVLGLAFKANTDDIRYSPALGAIAGLLQENAYVKVYDPIAMENARAHFPDIEYCSSAYEASRNADAILIMTEWDEFKKLDFETILKSMRGNVLIDARNILDPHMLTPIGFLSSNIGQAYLCN